MSFIGRYRPAVIATVVSVGVLVAAVGGISVAADSTDGKKSALVKPNQELKKNSIYSRHIKNRQVKNADLGRNAVQSPNVFDDSLTGADIKELSLGQVPSSIAADNAKVADSAKKADVADRLSNQTRIARTVLDIGRPTVPKFGVFSGGGNGDDGPGDAEKSDVRKELFRAGPISVVADCKRTSNGDGANPDDPFTNNGSFDEDGDEAKILVYTDDGTVSFNSAGQSSRRNIPPGEGGPVNNDNQGANGSETAVREVTGGEGKHMALGVARDPQQALPEDDWTYAYQFKSIYIAHSGGTEILLNVYAGIDVLGADDKCVFGGQVTQLG
jgi:hypothetical protein